MAPDTNFHGSPALRAVPDWLFEDDNDYSFAVDHFVMHTIRAGADSVAKLMATTYLAQFQDLKGEFARRPVYRPNFVVGYVPQSDLLIAHLNDVAGRGFVEVNVTEKELKVDSSSPDDKGALEDFLADSAQFSRLYQANARILKEHNPRELFQAVRDCYFRDQHLAEMFSYLEEPAVEEED